MPDTRELSDAELIRQWDGFVCPEDRPYHDAAARLAEAHLATIQRARLPITPERLKEAGFEGSRVRMMNRQFGSRIVIEFDDRGTIDLVQIGLDDLPHALWPESMHDIDQIIARLARKGEGT